MGVIYKLTSPSGKIYIGQTRQKWITRMRQHKNSIYVDDGGCRLLKKAIKKYGWNKFEKEVLVGGRDNDLDTLEKNFIIIFNCLSPNGYNLREGGANGKCSDETRKKIGENRVYKRSEDLPRHLIRIDNKARHGYIIEGHPLNKQRISFLSSNQTMDMKLTLARDCLAKLDNGELVEKTKHPRKPILIDGEQIILPQYVRFIKNKNAFKVCKPNTPPKLFGISTLTLGEKLILAKEYLETLN